MPSKERPGRLKQTTPEVSAAQRTDFQPEAQHLGPSPIAQPAAASARWRPGDLLWFQHALGNRATSRLLARTVVARAPSRPTTIIQRELNHHQKTTIKMYKAKLQKMTSAQERWTEIVGILKRLQADPTEEHIKEAAALVEVSVEKPADSPQETQAEPKQAAAEAAHPILPKVQPLIKSMLSEDLSGLAASFGCLNLVAGLGTLKSRKEEAVLRLRNLLIFAKYAKQVGDLLTSLVGPEDTTGALAAAVDEIQAQTKAIQIVPNGAGKLSVALIVDSMQAGLNALTMAQEMGASPRLILEEMFAHDKGYVVCVDSLTGVLDKMSSGIGSQAETEGRAVNIVDVLKFTRAKNSKTDIFTTNEDGLQDSKNPHTFMTLGERLRELTDTGAARNDAMSIAQARQQNFWYRTITPDMYMNMWVRLAADLMTELQLTKLGDIEPYLGEFRAVFPELPPTAFGAFTSSKK